MSDEEENADVTNDIQLNMSELINKCWAPVRELGKGMFGKVYHVCNVKDGREAAMKMEQINQESVLKIEVEVMKEMKGQRAALQIYDDGVTDTYRYVIMTLCGLDLTKISDLLHNKFSDSTILRVALRTLFAIKTLHEIGYVHRDLKPCNLALDYKKDSNVIYLLDFGMARRYARMNENQWIIRAPRSQCRFRGTLRYCSVNMHKRLELGRVDDLWSWLYMVIEMRTELPWTSSTHPDKVEIQKTELLNVTLNKDPLIKIFVPIAEHFQTLFYPDRPNYWMIFETIVGKMKEIGCKMSDPMDFDSLRQPDKEKLQEVAKKFNINLQQKSTLDNSDDKQMEILREGFQASSKDVPGGENYVIAKGRNFYFTPKTQRKTSDSVGKTKSATSLCVDIDKAKVSEAKIPKSKCGSCKKKKS